MSKKLSVNKFTVMRNGSNWIAGIPSYEEAMTVVNYLLESAGFKEEYVNDTIIAAYMLAGKPLDNEVRMLRFKQGYWFRPNRFGIRIRAIRTSQVFELEERLDNIDNKLVESTRSFNGSSLKKNTIEGPTKWKPHLFQPKEVWYAMSVQRHKGLTTLPRTKEPKQGNAEYVGGKIEKLSDQSEFRLPKSSIGLDTIIRRLHSLQVGAVECFRQLRSQHSGSNRGLKKLIMDIYHE